MNRPDLRELAREPLVHFLVLGGLLFLLGWGTGDNAGPQTDRIVVTPGHVEQLITTFARTWQRPPTRWELDGLIEEHIREEILYREALALGLDRDDVIIRRRMRQKMEFLTADVAETVEPTDEQLAAFLRENAGAYAVEPRFDMAQVYFSSDRRGEDAEGDALRMLERLRGGGGAAVDLDGVGDPSLLPVLLRQVTPTEVARQFGEAFAAEVAALPADAWVGPLRSGYGVHLVRISDRTDGRAPELDEVRAAVRRDWMAERRREVDEAVFERLREKYTVVVEPPELAPDAGAGQ